MHENHDELSAIRQHLSQTPTEGACALAGEGAQAGALPGALSGVLPVADEGAISTTSIGEDDDEVFEKQQHPSPGVSADKSPYEATNKGALLEALVAAGAGEGEVEGASSATSVHEDEIRQHLSYAPRTSILPVLSKTAVSLLHT